MDRILLLIIIGCLIVGGWVAGGAYLAQQVSPDWSPSDYTVKDGECWVHPQGDPLYDSFYAEKVNLPNCKAYESQEQAQHTEAQTRQIEWTTEQGKVGVFSILFVVCSILGLLVVAVVRG